MDVETDPLAVYVVIEYGTVEKVYGPFAFFHLAEAWARRDRAVVRGVAKLRPVSDAATAEPEASRG